MLPACPEGRSGADHPLSPRRRSQQARAAEQPCLHRQRADLDSAPPASPPHRCPPSKKRGKVPERLSGSSMRRSRITTAPPTATTRTAKDYPADQGPLRDRNRPDRPGGTEATQATGRPARRQAGKIELVVCRNVTNTVTTNGHRHKVTVEKCTTRLVPETVKFTIDSGNLGATVSRRGTDADAQGPPRTTANPRAQTDRDHLGAPTGRRVRGGSGHPSISPYTRTVTRLLGLLQQRRPR